MGFSRDQLPEESGRSANEGNEQNDRDQQQHTDILHLKRTVEPQGEYGEDQDPETEGYDHFGKYGNNKQEWRDTVKFRRVAD